ncbi:hypothetical protein B0I35DRAFT_414772 [Stachybotrys elegans]|uniref:Uncharacterized protein n=1 Tax=Stachybotrys elegans TaxID=80388 RepID=A0A8K0WJ66_9HYPO|nr:hypothetical protein B0I35DRAFT_414772 [Stachybotrys elegans]
MSLPIIHINGFPGVGKLTIARELVTLFGSYNARLVHNHLLIDPAGAILPRSSEDYQPLRKAIRAALFDTLATSRDTFNSLYIFTDFQSDNDTGRAVMAEYHAMAARRGCALIHIIVTSSKEENLRRVVTPERSQHGKLVESELLAQLREETVIYQPPADSFQIQLDTTELDAASAALILHQRILRIFADGFLMEMFRCCPSLRWTGRLKY